MAININGYSLTNDSGLKFNTTQTKFDSSNRILMPNKPSFFGSKTSSVTTLRQYPWVINSTTVNVNTCWNTSTGVFTCPVSGLYYTAWGGICRGGASNTPSSTNSGYMGVVKNGVLQHFTHWNTNDHWDNQNLETILYCNSGDTIAWAVHIAPAPDNGSGAGAYGDNHNMATIWLIG